MWWYKFKKKNYQIIEVKNGILSQDRCTSKTPCVSPTFLHLALRDPDRRQNRVSYVYWRYNKTAELSVSQSLRRHVLDICFPLIKPSGENRATGISGGEGESFPGSVKSFLRRDVRERNPRARVGREATSDPTINFNHNRSNFLFILLFAVGFRLKDLE